MINFIVWLIFGALAGWIASLLMKTDAQQGALGNIIVGIIGAFIGGFIMQSFGAKGVDGFNLSSLIVAVLGSVIFIALVKMFRRSAI